MIFLKYIGVFYVLILSISLGASDSFYSLPEGKDKNLVIAFCSPCHSVKLVSQNRMTRNNWDKTLLWMEKKQNMHPLPSDIRKKILDYLETNFSLADNKRIDYRRTNPLP